MNRIRRFADRCVDYVLSSGLGMAVLICLALAFLTHQVVYTVESVRVNHLCQSFGYDAGSVDLVFRGFCLTSTPVHDATNLNSDGG